MKFTHKPNLKLLDKFSLNVNLGIKQKIQERF